MPDSKMPNSRGDIWFERIKSFFVILGAVAVPVVLGIYANKVQSNMEKNNIRESYVRIAVGILSAQPKKVNPALRTWAVNIFVKYSPLHLNKQLQKNLREGDVAFPAFTNVFYSLQEGSMKDILTPLKQGLSHQKEVCTGSPPSST